jgi:hypothetical protein
MALNNVFNVPDGLRQVIEVNTEFGVIICVACRTAQTPSFIDRHLYDTHRTNRHTRNAVKQYIQECHLEDYNHRSVQLPEDGSRPQPLILVVSGFICRDCSFKSCSREWMRKHSIKEHNKKKLLDNELFMSAQLQSWFGEKRQRYWAVRCGETAEAADVEDSEAEENDGEDDVLAATQAIREDIQRWEEEAQGRRVTMLERAPAQEIDPWLQYTGWETVLRRSKHDLMMTAKYARDPDVEETDLSRLIRAWGLIVERCLDTLAEMDQKDALKWWASPKNEVASQRPFELPQSSHTIVKYSKVWERFICYFMRTAPLTRWDDETETGVVYTQQQWNCIVKIREDLEEEVVEEEEEDDDDEEDDRPTFADPVVTSLMNVVLLMIQQDTSNSGEYQSPMMHYLAVRGIHPETRGLMSTFHYTPILAGMLWMNRLLMLELTLPKDPWPEMGLVSKRNINNIPEVIQHV